MKTSRRDFLFKSALAASSLSFSLNSFGQSSAKFEVEEISKPASQKISIFSKHLHWLNYKDMAAEAAKMGFDGIDLTVRPDGHVLPERVQDDLPKAVEEIRKAGLEVYMITTAITRATDPHTDAILRVASKLGIANYRLGWFTYNKGISVTKNLEDFKERLTALQKLNKKYNIHGDYQNHAGDGFGSTVVDLWYVLKDLDSQWIGCQYDIRHATVEGANSWPIGLNLLANYIKTINIKDFRWAQKGKKWYTENVPLGEGMVNFNEYFKVLGQNKINVPICIHCEYELGGAEKGARQLTLAKEDVLNAIKKDLVLLKQWKS